LSIVSNNVENISVLAGLTAMQTLRASRNQIVDISALSNLNAIQSLDISSNPIVDISSISKLSRLQSFQLYDDLITDISPLVANQGLGPQSMIIGLDTNPLSERSRSEYELDLTNRGVALGYRLGGPCSY
jgi:Leucine-rich repeat (LRR) protein